MIIATYEILDYIPQIENNPRAGIEATLAEPRNGNTEKVYVNKKTVQKYITSQSGVHKICIEGTTDLFQFKEEVRLVFKYENDVKKDERLGNKLSYEDFTEADDKLQRLETLTTEMASTLQYGESKERDFVDHQGSLNSRLIWYAVIQICIVLIVALWQTLTLKNFLTK